MSDESDEQRITRHIAALTDIFGEPWQPPVTRYAEDPNTFEGDIYTEVKFGNFQGWLELTFFGNGAVSVETHIGHDARCGFHLDAAGCRPVGDEQKVWDDGLTDAEAAAEEATWD